MLRALIRAKTGWPLDIDGMDSRCLWDVSGGGAN